MKPVCIAGATHTFGAPPGWDDATMGECGALHIRRVVDPDLGVALRSAWQPTPEDLATLNAGGVVILEIVGDGHPVVGLWTEAVAERAPIEPANRI